VILQFDPLFKEKTTEENSADKLILFYILHILYVFLYILHTFIMRSLHEVHEMNAYSFYQCLSVCMIQLENHWTDMGERVKFDMDFMP
jgi:peptidoglycan biosynthesis protein MviN/MurJ (putative lipid II flippase)